MREPDGPTRRRTVEDLRHRLDSLEAAAAGFNLAQVMTRSFSGEIRYWSHGMERLYGFSRAEAVGRVSHELLHTEFPRSLDEIGSDLLEREEWTGELRHRHRDGRELVVVSHWSLQPEPAEALPLVTEVNTDVTEARRDQEARLRLASIVESSQDAIISKTLDGIVTSWNAAAQAIFGYAPEEMIGRPIDVLFPPERVHEERVIIERIRRGDRLRSYETVRRRKDGSTIEVSLTVSPIFDDSGAIVGASKIVRDITSEQGSQTRIQELQSELVHVARLSTMGQMASAIAHELNQPLTAMRNYAGALGKVLEGEAVDAARAREIVSRIASRAGAPPR